MALYQKSGTTSEERNLAYREWFRNQVDDKLLIDIRQATNKGLFFGSKRFVEEVKRSEAGQ
jgi:hypothetical protein